MAAESKIEWTDATWNPVTGCSVVSPGCTNCYAMHLAGARLQHHPSRAGLTKPSKAGPVWTGEVRLNEEWLTQPLRWKRPRMIFVCAHGDLFHESVPDAWIDRIFAVMQRSTRHKYQVLTKRSERMRAYITRLYACAESNNREWFDRGFCWPLGTSAEMARDRVVPFRHVWIGVSAERQKEADERIPDLLATPAAIRFVSCEPLLGPIDLASVDIRVGIRAGDQINALSGFDSTGGTQPRYPHLDWVIVGGESGDRPMHPDWARSLRDQCVPAGVPFFFKQWGTCLPVRQVLPGYGRISGATAVKPATVKLHCQSTPKQAPIFAFAEHGVSFTAMHDGLLTFGVGKKRAGRLLDGREWNEMPEAIRQ